MKGLPVSSFAYTRIHRAPDSFCAGCRAPVFKGKVTHKPHCRALHKAESVLGVIFKEIVNVLFPSPKK